MFERYTVAARSALFWAFYRADEAGCSSIAPEHLLAGILGADPAMAQRYPQLAELAPPPIPEPARPEILQPAPRRDLPLSQESQHSLACAAEEGERLGHEQIATEHLLLGLLREENSLAARALRAHGITLEEARENLTQEGGQSL